MWSYGRECVYVFVRAVYVCVREILVHRDTFQGHDYLTRNPQKCLRTKRKLVFTKWCHMHLILKYSISVFLWILNKFYQRVLGGLRESPNALALSPFCYPKYSLMAVYFWGLKRKCHFNNKERTNEPQKCMCSKEDNIFY